MDPSVYSLYPRSDASSIRIIGHPTAPYTTPSLTTNLICRVLFALLANLACTVPLSLLWKNGEFAAVVFIANTMVQNLRTVVNSLLWRNDNTAAWYPGYVLCDIDAYIVNITIALFATCLLAVMRNLAIQVGSLRANPLTQRERRRRNLVQALIMFPLPLVQIGLVFPLAKMRYAVLPLIGCSWSPFPSWLYIAVFILPPVLIALATAVYAVLVYLRYRDVAKTTVSALSSNRVATQRVQRTRRRLYLMVLSILIPFVPISVALGVANILLMGPIQPFDFDKIHNNPKRPWSTIVYVPSNLVDVYYLNNCYIPVITAVPIFWFFGMTKDAINCYRKAMLFLGFGKLFPTLHQEYDPDRDVYSSSNGMTVTPKATTTKSSLFPSLKQLNSITSSSSICAGQRNEPISLNHLSYNNSNNNDSQQPPEVTILADPIYPSHDPTLQPPLHTPLLCRTRLNLPVIPFKIPFFTSKANQGSSSPPGPQEAAFPASSNHV